jgi:O-antigen/teichoic acid export membrane protein
MPERSSRLAILGRRYTSGAGRNGLWAIVEYAAYPFFMLVATPFFLRWLGAEQYGRWMLVLVFTGFGGITGLGMGIAATREVSSALGRDDKPDALACVRTCLAVTISSSLAFSLLILALGLAFGGRLFGKIGPWQEVWPLLVFAAGLVFLEQVDQVFAGALRGAQRFDLSARVETIAKLLSVIAALIAAKITGELTAVLTAIVAITLLRMTAKALFTAKLLSGPAYLPVWHARRAARIFRFGKWVWLQGMGSALFSTADRLLIGSLLGATSLSHYSVCIQLTQQIQSIPAAAAQVLFPTISNRMSAGQDFWPLATRGSLLVFAAAVVAGLLVIIFAHPLLLAWLGPEFADQDTFLLRLLAVSFMILAANVGPHFVLYGLGRSGIVAVVNLGAGLLALALAWITIPHWGILGGGSARLAYAAVTCVEIAVLVLIKLRWKPFNSETR